MALSARVRPVLGTAYNRLMGALPPRVAGRVDYTRPRFRHGWGGPFNGQAHRQQIVRELYGAIPFTATFETGSFRGHSTAFMAAVSGKPVLSVEASERFLEYSERNCAPYGNVEFTLGDSRSFLDANVRRFPGPHFYYLDAHWYDDLPLADEVRTIAAGRSPAVVMVDDFEVPGDAGYTFDDYGPGARLDAALLAPVVPDEWGWFYPSVGSGEESGLKRGCVVLATPDLSEVLDSLPSLRRRPS